MDEYLRGMFKGIDRDGSGEIDRKELADLSTAIGRNLTEVELDVAMLEMDSSGDGMVDVEEFIVWFNTVTDNDRVTRDLFEQADTDGSGVIDRSELVVILTELGHDTDEATVDEVMKEIDKDGGGEIEFDEFNEWWSKVVSEQAIEKIKAKGRDPHEEYLQSYFNQADADGSGEIDVDELVSLMRKIGRPVRGVEAKIAFSLMDEDNSGSIDFAEFKSWFEWMRDGDLTINRLFDIIDKDGSGSLDQEEVGWMLSNLLGGEAPDIEAVMAEMDADASGAVDQVEFSHWWMLQQVQGGATRKQLFAEGEKAMALSGLNLVDEEARAATILQAFLRGWLSRKHFPVSKIVFITEIFKLSGVTRAKIRFAAEEAERLRREYLEHRRARRMVIKVRA